MRSTRVPKILEVYKDWSADDFWVHTHLGGYSVKIVNNGVVTGYPSRSLVYNAVDSWLAAAECTLWVVGVAGGKTDGSLQPIPQAVLGDTLLTVL